MKRLITLLIYILILTILLIYKITADDNEYYINLLQYGTDSDIVKAFSQVHEDLGGSVNKKTLEIFQEKHSERVYLTIVQYIGLVKLQKAQDILLKELSRKTKNDDYRERVIKTIGELKNSGSLDALSEIYNKKETSIRIKQAIIDAYGKIGDKGIEGTLIDRKIQNSGLVRF